MTNLEIIEKNLEEQVNTLFAKPQDITENDIKKLWKPTQDARDAVNNAANAYEKDLSMRQSVLDEQAKTIEIKINEFANKIKLLEDKSRDAASRGNIDEAAELDEQAETIRAQLEKAKRKKRIASSTELKGDAALYKSVKEACEYYLEVKEICLKYVNYAENQIEKLYDHFERLKRQTRFEYKYAPTIDVNKLEKIEHHYNAEFYVQQDE